MPISRKKYILVLGLSIAALVLVLLLALRQEGTAPGRSIRPGEHPLRISEYMANNTAFPSGDGVLCDWIEIENTSDRAFDVSGYRLSDDVTQARYAFPMGTVIPAGGQVVVWCTPERSGGLYAPFSLKKQGGETILLMSPANTVLDRVDTLRSPRNLSLVRGEDGALDVSSTPTPGFPNTDAGYSDYLAAQGLGTWKIRLSEIMSAEKLICGPDGLSCDWIEVENISPETVDLSGMRLSDREGEGRFVFPQGTELAPGGFLVVWCAGDRDASPDRAPFQLGKQGGETVVLSDREGRAIDRAVLPFLQDDTAYARRDGGWAVTNRPTPGYPNTPEGYTAWAASLGYGASQVCLSEICLQNLESLPDGEGAYPDWIELYNAGESAVSLEGWYLSDNPEKPARWRFPALTLSPGERRIVFASGKDRTEGELHTDFSLSAGETVTLRTPEGVILDQTELPEVAPGLTWARQDGGWGESAPTPGG